MKNLTSLDKIGGPDKIQETILSAIKDRFYSDGDLMPQKVYNDCCKCIVNGSFSTDDLQSICGCTDLKLDQIFDFKLNKEEIKYWDEKIKKDKRRYFSKYDAKKKEDMIRNYIIISAIHQMEELAKV